MEFILGIKGWFDVRNYINRIINTKDQREKLWSFSFLPQNANNNINICLWFLKTQNLKQNSYMSGPSGIV